MWSSISLAFAALFLAPTASAATWQPFVQYMPLTNDQRYTWDDQCDAQRNVPQSEPAWCENLLGCILDNTDEALKINMAGAAILLGLAPTILGNLAPTIENLAFLSSQRPLLSFFLAASTATTNTGRPLGDVDPLGSVLETLSRESRFKGIVRLQRGRFGPILSLVEYVLAIAATINVVLLSYQLTLTTVVSWSCPNWAWVISWSCIPAALHLFSMLVFRLTVRQDKKQSSYEDPYGSHDDIAIGVEDNARRAITPNSQTSRTQGYSQVSQTASDLSQLDQGTRGGIELAQRANIPRQNPDEEYSANIDFSSKNRSGYAVEHTPRSIDAPRPSIGSRIIGFFWEKEFQPCVQRKLPIYRVNQNAMSQLGRWVAPILCYAQYCLGTAILASLFPVIVRDSFHILARYVISGVIAQCILRIELDGLKERNNDWKNGVAK